MIPNLQAYQYDGPEEFHAVVGQIMAYLGYAGGHEPLPVGAQIVLRNVAGRYILEGWFGCDEKRWHSAASLGNDAEPGQVIKNLILHWHQRCYGTPVSRWGTLTGVRPTKLVHHLRDQERDENKIMDILVSRYHVQPDTARYLITMTGLQRPYIERPDHEAALYIGIPYCPSHCLYCSFPSRLSGSELPSFMDRFIVSVVRDIQDIAALCRQYDIQIRSVYIGGGTPTCLPIAGQEAILQAVAGNFREIEEWTVEAGRPDTAGEEVLALLRRYGVNRISVNPQTMQQRLLDLLGRRHRVEDVFDMFSRCRKMGFSVINMDFIAGLPEQTQADMQENMEIVCQLHPENVTIHTLALKKRAPLFHHPLRQQIPPAREVSSMLQSCGDVLKDHGYIPYYMYRQKYMAGSFANVGYAQRGTISRYNIQMMEERQTILSAGPGSTTKFLSRDGHSLKKIYMPKDPEAYVQALSERIRQRRHLCAMIYGGDDT